MLFAFLQMFDVIKFVWTLNATFKKTTDFSKKADVAKFICIALIEINWWSKYIELACRAKLSYSSS